MLPTLYMRQGFDLETLQFADFDLQGYDPHPAIKFEISV